MDWSFWIREFGNGAFYLMRDVLVPLSWPILALIVALIFREDFSKLLARVKEAGTQGLKLDPDPQSRPSETPTELSDEVFERVGEQAPTGLQPWIRNIQQVVASNPALREEGNLIQALAIANRRAFFESVLRVIYGTQIRVLGRLQDGPVSPSELKYLHELHLARAGDHAIRSLEGWMVYLINSYLVEVVDGQYAITEFGRSFYDLFLESGIDPDYRVW